jgi:5'-methylthioadenosine phosphorylase
MDGLTGVEQLDMDTPFGKPSDLITVGELDGVGIAFVPRHGRGHRLIPSEIPYRANVFALKTLGVERLVSVSAVGSLREEIAPLDMLIPDQLIDRTRSRESTFFGDGLAVHVSMADPYCADLSGALAGAVRGVGATVHPGGTYVVMEGPAFSTRAESQVYRGWGASVIGMTALPEAKLAREAEMCYATLACVTDYDVWREGDDDVTTDMIMANLSANVEASQRALRALLPHIAGERTCACEGALASAIATGTDMVPAELRSRLAPLVAKYLA